MLDRYGEPSSKCARHCMVNPMLNIENAVEQYRRLEFYSGSFLAQEKTDKRTFVHAAKQFLKYRIKRKKLEKYCLLIRGAVPESEEWSQRKKLLDGVVASIEKPSLVRA